MIPIFIEIGMTIAGKQSAKEGFKNSVRSIADIIRTPIYGLTIMISSCALLIVGPFAPHSIYSFRKALGEIEQCQNWGFTGWSEKANWTLSSCFQPFPISYLERYDNKTHENTLYSDDPLERQLTNFASSAIYHKRGRLDPYDCHHVPQKQTYASLILQGT